MKRENSFLTAAAAFLAASLSFHAVPVSAQPETEVKARGGIYEDVVSRLKEFAGTEASFSGVEAFTGDSREFSELDKNAEVAEARGKAGVRSTGKGKRFVPPPNSRAFMPDYMTKAAPESLWPLDSSQTQENAQALADMFKKAYPDVVYHVEWEDETVNAYAWMEGEERHVALLGGLMRHKAVKAEGLGLVLAHEIGHHYGGEPTYPGSNLACEGPADYWGAKTGMRAVWGNQYKDQMLPAIDQLYALFSKGVEKSVTAAYETKALADSKGCSHPPAACRKETYLAAMDGKPRPACSGLLEQNTLVSGFRSDSLGAL